MPFYGKGAIELDIKQKIELVMESLEGSSCAQLPKL